MLCHCWSCVRRSIAAVISAGAVADLIPQSRPLCRRVLLLVLRLGRLKRCWGRRLRLRHRCRTECTVSCVVARDGATVIRGHRWRQAEAIIGVIRLIHSTCPSVRDCICGKTRHVGVGDIDARASKEAVLVVRFVFIIEDVKVLAPLTLADDGKDGNNTANSEEANNSEDARDGTFVRKEAIT